MKLSVCLTHYNRPHLLAATLESLARQTRLPDEVLVWDDCSPNDPTEVAKNYAGRFPKFIYHRNARNLGMPGNLNAVLACTTGELIANLHDADEYHPTLLQKWEEALLRHPRAGLVFCGLDATTASTDGEKIWIHPCAEYTAGRDFFRQHYVGNSSSIIWGTVMVRREVYARHLPFDSQFRNWADLDTPTRQRLAPGGASLQTGALDAKAATVVSPLPNGLRQPTRGSALRIFH